MRGSKMRENRSSAPDSDPDLPDAHVVRRSWPRQASFASRSPFRLTDARLDVFPPSALGDAFSRDSPRGRQAAEAFRRHLDAVASPSRTFRRQSSTTGSAARSGCWASRGTPLTEAGPLASRSDRRASCSSQRNLERHARDADDLRRRSPSPSTTSWALPGLDEAGWKKSTWPSRTEPAEQITTGCRPTRRRPRRSPASRSGPAFCISSMASDSVDAAAGAVTRGHQDRHVANLRIPVRCTRTSEETSNRARHSSRSGPSPLPHGRNAGIQRTLSPFVVVANVPKRPHRPSRCRQRAMSAWQSMGVAEPDHGPRQRPLTGAECDLAAPSNAPAQSA